MANEKPTTGARVVPIDLSIERRMILRDLIRVWCHGDREDLQNLRHKLTDPARTRRRIATYERMMDALDRGQIELPDEEARSALQAAADGFDEAEEWEETKVVHDVQRALLAVLASGETASGPGVESGEAAATWTTGDDDLAIESAVLRRVLGVHPAGVTEAELVREVAGEGPSFGERDAVERAARDLGGIGLLHTRCGFVTPTRAALRFEELLDR